MRALLLSSRTSFGRRLQRTYAGGLGTVTEEDETCLLPPYDLLRIAGIARAAGITPVVVDEEVSGPAPQLDPADTTVLLWVSLPSLGQDVQRLAEYASAGHRCVAYTSIRDQSVWHQLLTEGQCSAVLLPEGVGQADAVLGGETGPGAVTAQSLADGSHGAGRFGPLADEPLPARDLIDHSAYSFPPLAEDHITTANASFGCPYPCSFYCPYPLSEGKTIRAFSVDRVTAEFEHCAELGLKGIVFRDPVFTINRPRTLELCRILTARAFGIPWWCETRVDRLDEDLIAAMAAAGCRGIEVGIESGDVAMQQGAVRKRLSLNRVRDLYEVARRAGVNITSLFLIGLPGETRTSIVNTLVFVLELGLSEDEYDIGLITPYPGTPLGRLATERQWLTSTDYGQFTSYTPVMRIDTLGLETLSEAMELVSQLHDVDSDDPGQVQSFRDRLRAWAEPIAEQVR